VYVTVIIFVALFYTAMIFNPDDVAENLQKYGGCVPGIQTGRPTARYLNTILMRNTLVWSILLAVVVILPELMSGEFRGDALTPYDGIWLLIVAGVSMDTVQQIQAQLIRRPRLRPIVRSDEESASFDSEPEWLTDVDYERFVPVLTPRDAAMVPFVESLLRSAGIRCFVKNEEIQDLFGVGRLGTGFSTFTGPPTVSVEPGRAEEAAGLLANIEAQQPIGTIVHYFAKPQVGVIHLAADLTVGETLRFCGHGADFAQIVESMQDDYRPVQTASAASDVAIKVDRRVRAGTRVYRVRPHGVEPASAPASSRSPRLP
jgi:hypothetical protein